MNTGRSNTEPLHDAPRTATTNDVAGAFGLDDLTYDLVTVLHEKSKGLKAYDKYVRDAQGDEEARQLLERIRSADLQAIAQLRQCLSKTLASTARVPLKSRADEDRE